MVPCGANIGPKDAVQVQPNPAVVSNCRWMHECVDSSDRFHSLATIRTPSCMNGVPSPMHVPPVYTFYVFADSALSTHPKPRNPPDVRDYGTRSTVIAAPPARIRDSRGCGSFPHGPPNRGGWGFQARISPHSSGCGQLDKPRCGLRPH